MRQFFTAEDIRRLAEEDVRHLILSAEDVITAEAADTARRLGVVMRRGGEAQEDRTRPFDPVTAVRSGAPIIHVRAETIHLQPFAAEAGRPEMAIRLTDVITGACGSPMAAGFMTWEKGSFPWTLTYDEIDLVLEGQLEIRKNDQRVLADPGDVLYIPRGSEIHFGSPSHARVFYVTYPANWEGQP